MIRQIGNDVISELRSGVALTSISQCVEELVLNSVDAGSTSITVDLDISNRSVKVSDNGIGIHQNDLKVMGNRYFTSKCKSPEDLKNAASYGYRGEAVASLGKICVKLEIISRQKTSYRTFCKLVRNGKDMGIYERPKPRSRHGTTVLADGIFDTLPVRKNLVSAVDVEHIRRCIAAIAIIHPEISFSFHNKENGNVYLQTRHSLSTLSIVSQIFGCNQSKAFKPINHILGSFKVSGYVSLIEQQNKNLQFVFINKRLVLKTKLHKIANRILSKRCNQISQSDDFTQVLSQQKICSPKMQDKYAGFIINLECPCNFYDITFDPAKTLVEFENWHEPIMCLMECLNNFLINEGFLSAEVSDKPMLTNIGLKIEELNVVTETKLSASTHETNLNSSSQNNPDSKITICSSNVRWSLHSSTAKRKAVCLSKEKEKKLPRTFNLDSVIQSQASDSVFSNISSNCEPGHSTKLRSNTISQNVSCNPNSWYANALTKFSKGTSNRSPKQTPRYKSIKEKLDLKMNIVGCSKNNSMEKPVVIKSNGPGREFGDSGTGSNGSVGDGEEDGHIIGGQCDDFSLGVSVESGYGNIGGLHSVHGDCVDKKDHCAASTSIGHYSELSLPAPIGCSNSGMSTGNSEYDGDYGTDTSIGNKGDDNGNFYGAGASACDNNNHYGDCYHADNSIGDNSDNNGNLNSVNDLYFPGINTHGVSDNGDCYNLGTSIGDSSDHDSNLNNNVADDSSKNCSSDLEWFDHYDPTSGRQVYVNLRTGNTSLTKPVCKQNSSKTKPKNVLKTKKLHPFAVHLSHNYTPWLPRDTSSVLQKEKCCHSKEKKPTRLDTLFKNWINPVFEANGKAIIDGSFHSSNKGFVKAHGTPLSYHFTKDCFKDIKVINQLDNKFILCHLYSGGEEKNNLLVIVDQHAAHERVRLEKFTNELYTTPRDGANHSCIKSSKLTSPCKLYFSKHAVECMISFRTQLERVGITFVQELHVPSCAEQQQSVIIKSAPTVFLGFVNENWSSMSLERNIEYLIKEQIEVLLSTKRASTSLPKSVIRTLNSQACHGAIRFGDILSIDDCKYLMNSLSKCDLPFQCAHGRPSMIPLISLKLTSRDNPRKNVRSPQLWKLKKGMKNRIIVQ